MNRLDDETALITGGGRDIGRAIALQLAQRGARVAVAARSEDELVERTAAITAAGGRAHAVVADLAAPGAGTRLAPRALDELGRVDILIRAVALSVDDGARHRQRLLQRRDRPARAGDVIGLIKYVRGRESHEDAA